MGKSNITEIVRDHFDTLRDARTEKIKKGDLLFQVGAPVLFGFLCFLSGWWLEDASNAIMGISIVAALMCAMAVLVFQIRMEASADRRLGENDLLLINELFANIMWAILVGLLLAFILIAFDALSFFSDGFSAQIATSISLAICTHFIIVIAMCLKRLQRAYNRVAAKKR